jgi:hypothetical protein
MGIVVKLGWEVAVGSPEAHRWHWLTAEGRKSFKGLSHENYISGQVAQNLKVLKLVGD